MAESEAIAAKCNYAGHYEKYVTCPLAGPLPLPGNICRIFDALPVMGDILGFLGSFEEILLSPLYFDRADVKHAIQAPANVDQTECSNVNVFPRGDAMIVHWFADFILIAEVLGSLFRRNGLLGLQMHIANDSFLVDGVGSLGTAHTERRLPFLEVELSSHMYVPPLYPHHPSGAPFFAPAIGCLPKHCVPHGILLNTVLKRYDLHRYL
ncbi:hypothetical protein B0H14DRAFT_2606973 [Mycena olivaceomarginata]|nr:hypothetical protein B0H14DRAFT_2606973 [Mycena olivaceomarginata]